MKTLSIALTSLLTTFALSYGAYEAEATDCCPSSFPVYVPTSDSCYHVYESVMFLRPSSDNLGWGVVNDFLPSSSPQWQVENIQPNYHPAFNIDLCYTFPCTGINMELNWTHLRSSDTQSVKTSPASQRVSPFIQTGEEIGALTKAHAKLWNQYDAVNWDTGVRLNAGPYMVMRFFTGIGGVRIKEKITSRFAQRGGEFPRIRFNNTCIYQGIGPRFGFDGAYDVCGNVKFVGSLVTGLFFGCQEPAQYRFEGSFANSEGSGDANKQRIASHSIIHAVPSVEANLGMSWDSCVWGHDFSIEAGYMGAVYINALKGYEANTNGQSLEQGLLSAISVKRVQSNFSLDGPYARFNIDF